MLETRSAADDAFLFFGKVKDKNAKKKRKAFRKGESPRVARVLPRIASSPIILIRRMEDSHDPWDLFLAGRYQRPRPRLCVTKQNGVVGGLLRKKRFVCGRRMKRNFLLHYIWTFWVKGSGGYNRDKCEIFWAEQGNKLCC